MPEAHSHDGTNPVEDTGRDLDVRAIRNGAIAIAVGILFALAGAYFMMRVRGPAANTPAQPFHAPTPLLQTAPQIERADYFKEKARLTGSYGWVDRQAGIARIPVDEAMRLMAARAGQDKPAAPAKEAP